MNMRTKLAAGNWKMNGNRAALAEVSALLVEHFPAGDDAGRGNELPDDPVVIR